MTSAVAKPFGAKFTLARSGVTSGVAKPFGAKFTVALSGVTSVVAKQRGAKFASAPSGAPSGVAKPFGAKFTVALSGVAKQLGMTFRAARLLGMSLLLVAAAPDALGAQPAASDAPRTQPARVVLPLVVHTVHVDDKPIAPPDFIALRVARANEIFAPYGVAFEIIKSLPLPAAHAQMKDRPDRDALAQYTARGAIDLFVVEELADVDEPGRMRRGVHWHARTRPGAHFVILSLLGGESVLAHELGHYLGNPEHSETPGNLMSYQHTEVLPFLDPAQQTKLQRALRNYRKTRELKPVPQATAR